jgi:YD repeat-containing protein
MKLTIAVVMISTAVYGQSFRSASAGPTYDGDGRLTAYVYADGKRESYSYDSSWRMARYTDRNGNITIFVYNADGSVTVWNPDGSKQDRSQPR